jgi:hypothetical protein
MADPFAIWLRHGDQDGPPCCSQTPSRRGSRRHSGSWSPDLTTDALARTDKEEIGIAFIQGDGTPHTIEAMLELRSNGYDPPISIATVSVLSPGTFRAWVRRHGWGGSIGGRWGTEVTFTDRDGSHWIRRTARNLEELGRGPIRVL